MRIVRARLKRTTSQEESERVVSAAEEAVTKAIPQTLSESATLIADSVDRSRPRLLRERRRLEAGFQKRLHRTWAEGIDRLETLVHAFMEFGEKYYQDGFHPDGDESPALFRALSELHARSCRVAGEILCLMKAGFADGALARWRTLHEIAVVAQFLGKHGEATAERYLLHDAVRTSRAAERFAVHSAAMGWEPVDEDELRSLRAERDALVQRFGKAFRTDLGWAADVLSKERPGLDDLEADLGLAHWRSFYGWASDGVHAGPGGLRPTGIQDHGEAFLVAGPTNAALADPGQYTALSLAQILSALIAHSKQLDYIAMYMAFNEQVKRCQAALMSSHEAVKTQTNRNLQNTEAKRARAPRPRRRPL
jgi:hypothetical protein